MKPILRDFPYSFETERLLIRGPLPGDGVVVRTAVIESQNELKPWMPWAVTVDSEEGHEVRVREGQLKFLAREDLWMMLFHKESNTYLGGSGLHRINWEVPSFEIGYWVRTSFAGQGYITEAVSGITNFAFDQLGAERIEIRCDEKNKRSAAVARRCAYILEGILRAEARDHLTHQLRNTMIFSKIRADWHAS